jgi:hypothetical protein
MFFRILRCYTNSIPQNKGHTQTTLFTGVLVYSNRVNYFWFYWFEELDLGSKSGIKVLKKLTLPKIFNGNLLKCNKLGLIFMFSVRKTPM